MRACDCVERNSSNALQIASKREFRCVTKGQCALHNAHLQTVSKHIQCAVVSHFADADYYFTFYSQCALFLCAFLSCILSLFLLSKVVLEHHTVHYSLCSVGMYGVRWSSSLSWRRCLHECCLSLYLSFSSSLYMCLCVCMPMMKCMSEFNEQRNVSVKLMHTHIQNSCHSVQRL